MNVQIYDNEVQLGEAAARLFADRIIAKPDIVLGLATGSTALSLYNSLIEMYGQGTLDFREVRSFNLDEYVGLDRSHEQSYYRFMLDNLFSKINIQLENVQVPHPASDDLDADCAAYEAAIEAAGGIDLQLLGIGRNGHIAFDEPRGYFPVRTHIEDLSETTIEANKRFFDSADDVPKFALSMGIGSIFKAREIILIATGASKADAVAAMINGPITPECPASILQLHPNTTVFLDEDAASKLQT